MSAIKILKDILQGLSLALSESPVGSPIGRLPVGSRRGLGRAPAMATFVRPASYSWNATVALVMVIFSVLAPWGCNGDYWFGDGNETRAKVETPTGVQAGQVMVSYMLSGTMSAEKVAVSFSADGLVFRNATRGRGGEGLKDLAVSKAGMRHTFSWDSAQDLEQVRSSSVILRITPEDGISGRTSPMVVHNRRFLAALTGPEPQSGRSRLLFAEVGAVRGEVEVLQADVLPESNDLSDVIYEGGHYFVSHSMSGTVTALELDEEKQALVQLPEIQSPFPDGGAKLLAADGSHLFLLNLAAGTLRAVRIDKTSDPMRLEYGPSISVPGGQALAVRPGRLAVVCESAGKDLIHILDISDENHFLEDSAWMVTGMEAPTSLALQNQLIYVASARPDSLWTFRDENDNLTIDDTRTSTTAIPGIWDLSIDSNRLLAVEGFHRILSLPLGSDGQLHSGQGTSFGNPDRTYSLARGAGKAVVVASPTTEGVEIGTWTADENGIYEEAFALPVTSSSSIKVAISD